MRLAHGWQLWPLLLIVSASRNPVNVGWGVQTPVPASFTQSHSALPSVTFKLLREGPCVANT